MFKWNQLSHVMHSVMSVYENPTFWYDRSYSVVRYSHLTISGGPIYQKSKYFSIPAHILFVLRMNLGTTKYKLFILSAFQIL